MIKIKATQGEQIFRAKGDSDWTVKTTDAEGMPLPILEGLTTELCLQHLANFVYEASGKKVSKRAFSKEKPSKSTAKKAQKLSDQRMEDVSKRD